MRDEYDLSEMKPRDNPQAHRLKKQISIHLGEDVLDYFEAMAAETGMSVQRLIDLYLRDCMIGGRKLSARWAERVDS